MSRCPNHAHPATAPIATVRFGGRDYCAVCAAFLAAPIVPVVVRRDRYSDDKRHLIRNLTQLRCAAIRTSHANGRGQQCQLAALEGQELCRVHARTRRVS